MVSLHVATLFLILCCPVISCSSKDAKYNAVRTSADGPAVCGQENPAAKYTVRSRVECSSKCRHEKGCIFFNFITSLNEKPACHLYFDEPQIKFVEQHCALYGREGVKTPVEKCSFPYTYNGGLFYQCLENMIEIQPCGCRGINFTLQHCDACPGFEATHADINIPIPTQPGEVPVTSVFGWMVIHQRFGQNFNWDLPWVKYKDGFGDINADFWFGLEKIHLLTTFQPYRLRVEVQSGYDNLWYSAEYWSFQIEDEANKYRLRVSGYSGDAGNALQYTGSSGAFLHDGKMFTTYDEDNDIATGGNCADWKDGGWWHAVCYWACLTCTPTTHYTWYDLPGNVYVINNRMMIKQQ